MSLPDPAHLTTLTFDCYETGAIEALRPLLLRHRIALSDDAIITAFLRYVSDQSAELNTCARRTERRATGVITTVRTMPRENCSATSPIGLPRQPAAR
jgi:hypothetical protein